MDVNTLNSVSNAYPAVYAAGDPAATKDKAATSAETEAKATASDDSVAVVYEKNNEADTTKASYSDKVNNKKGDRSAIIKQLQADAERLKNNLLDIVRQSMSGQANAFALSIAGQDEGALWKKIANGEFTATADQIAQAKKDIADDGYWGVEQTSSRIVDFAITLSGGDTEKADMLYEAFKKGYAQATSAWGKELPDISKRTYDAVTTKFEQWKNGTYNASNAASVEG